MDFRARHQAQQRVERIKSFREELRALEREEALALSPDQRAGLEAHHEGLLTKLAAEFDLDVTEAGWRMSWGVRLAALLGGAAFFAAAVLFLHRIWGALGLGMQVVILVTLPLLVLAAAEVTFRRRADPFITALLVLAAGVGFIVEVNAFGSIFNMAPSVLSLLAWGSFAWLVAHAYGLRLLLAAGLVLLAAFGAGMLVSLEGGYWVEILERSESLFAGAGLMYLVPWVAYRRDGNDFGLIYRLCGAGVALIAVLILSMDGSTSCLPFRESTVEALYQMSGIAVSAAIVYHGYRLGRTGLVNVGAVAFVVFLYIRLHVWWWDWMPKSLFFLLVGLMALALILLFRRLRSRLTERRPA